MPTTLTTHTITIEGNEYTPRLWRAFASVDLTTGSSQTFKVPCHRHRTARVSWLVDGLKAASTLTLQVDTGPVNALTVANKHGVMCSSGALVISIGSTGRGSAAFTGLGRFVELRLIDTSTGVSGASTGVFVDFELV